MFVILHCGAFITFIIQLLHVAFPEFKKVEEVDLKITFWLHSFFVAVHRNAATVFFSSFSSFLLLFSNSVYTRFLMFSLSNRR